MSSEFPEGSHNASEQKTGSTPVIPITMMGATYKDMKYSMLPGMSGPYLVVKLADQNASLPIHKIHPTPSR